MEIYDEGYLLRGEKEQITRTELRVILYHYYQNLSIIDEQFCILSNDETKLRKFINQHGVTKLRKQIKNPKIIEKQREQFPDII